MRRLTIPICALLLSAACSDPPQKELDRAQGAIDAARAAGAERYATTEFTTATAALKQAHDAVAQGDYRLALSRALDASERAQQSARLAADGKARARSEAESALGRVAISQQQLRSAIKAAESARVPPTVLAPARKTLASTEAVLQKVRALLSAGEYLDAMDSLKSVTDQIGRQILALNEAQKTRAGRRRS
jgi:tetratricopeptide (TPR) repeat protein